MATITKYSSSWEPTTCKIINLARTVPITSGGGFFYKFQYHVNYTCNAQPKQGINLELTNQEYTAGAITYCFLNFVNFLNRLPSDFKL
jgi:hypothetical protein